MAQDISRGAWNIGNNRPELPYQPIEERGLADIRSAYQSDVHFFATTKIVVFILWKTLDKSTQ